jgi:SAM-dependent methyltransferase
MIEPKERFSDRVDDYVRYRPSYPPALVATLEREHGLAPPATVADVGAGTGISSRLLLDAGFEVFAVEPNEPMRRAAERDGASYPLFHSISGSAEATTLAPSSVDAVLAAQAFHWFDRARAKLEMRRILRGPRLVVLIWNERRVRGAFLEAYERLLVETGVDYLRVRHQDAASPQIVGAFYDRAPRVHVFENVQRFDRDGLVGRARSSSYVPKPGQAGHDAFFDALGALFDAHAEDGRVAFEYDTRMYVGALDPG